ncbi:MAG: molybdate ABC transporter substrate-binding protein [Pelobacteraceae bacterium]
MKLMFTLVVAIICTLLQLNPAVAGEVSISAAASLKEVVNELSASYAKKNPGVTFIKNYGGSGQLAKQIEQGVPADIFISANTEWMEYLKSRRVVDVKSIATFAYNELVFAGRPDLKVSGMRDVVKLARIAIGSPKSVPAGEYAMEAFGKAGIDRQLEKKLVMAKDVRECLMYADRGEVDGAFVYRTDALQAARHAAILFTVPQDLYPRVSYPMALTLSGAKKHEAAGFLAFLKSAEAKAVLTKHGFQVK